MGRQRILVTNDDGIDSVGLHLLARAMCELGEVIVVAPDQEYSGSSASIGALHTMTPEAHRTAITGVDISWAVTGPPGLCVMLARLGAFGPQPDLIVSGINPGANVGHSVYHSGTIGAALTGRIGGIPGLAVSQPVDDLEVEGQGWEEALAGQCWSSAATVARAAARAMLADPPPDSGVLNLNVPNLPLSEIQGWEWSGVGQRPPRATTRAALVPKPGHEGTYHVQMSWGEEQPQPERTDTAALMDDRISVTWLSRITAVDLGTPTVDAALNRLLAERVTSARV
jgi:5'-nucleotidase